MNLRQQRSRCKGALVCICSGVVVEVEHIEKWEGLRLTKDSQSRHLE